MLKKIFALSVVVVLFSAFIVAKNESRTNGILQTDGKQLFMVNCGTCHHPTRDLTGPSFYGVRNRWKNKKLLYEYIKNSTAVIKKDPYAKQLFEKWNKTIMTPFPKLTNANIDAIFDYVDGEAKKKGLLN